jgi:hypothetical protein
VVTLENLKEVFGNSKYYFQIDVPKGEHPIEYVTAKAKTSVFVSVIGGSVFAASDEHNAFDTSIILQEIQ